MDDKEQNENPDLGQKKEEQNTSGHTYSYGQADTEYLHQSAVKSVLDTSMPYSYGQTDYTSDHLSREQNHAIDSLSREQDSALEHLSSGRESALDSLSSGRDRAADSPGRTQDDPAEGISPQPDEPDDTAGNTKIQPDQTGDIIQPEPDSYTKLQLDSFDQLKTDGYTKLQPDGHDQLQQTTVYGQQPDPFSAQHNEAGQYSGDGYQHNEADCQSSDGYQHNEADRQSGDACQNNVYQQYYGQNNMQGQNGTQQDYAYKQPDSYDTYSYGRYSEAQQNSGQQYGTQNQETQQNGCQQYSAQNQEAQQNGTQQGCYQQYGTQNGCQQYGTQNEAQQGRYQQYGRFQKPGASSGNGFGIASMVLGILSLVLFCTCINIPLAITAVIFGILQLGKKAGGRGMAVTGIVTAALSVIALIASVVLLWGPFKAYYYEELMDDYPRYDYREYIDNYDDYDDLFEFFREFELDGYDVPYGERRPDHTKYQQNAAQPVV